VPKKNLFGIHMAAKAAKHGSIKSLVQGRGFGFIKYVKEDLFFHASDLVEGECFEDARVGNKVSFSIRSDSEGNRRAVSVSLRVAAEEHGDRMTPPARPIVKKAVVPTEAVQSAMVVAKKVAQSAKKITEILADKESSKTTVMHVKHDVEPAPPAEQKQAAASPAVPSVKHSWADVARSARKITETQADTKAKVTPPTMPTFRGSIKSLVQARGFGFIKTGKATPDLFFHVLDCEFFENAKVGEKVSFAISTDSQGNRKAVSVRRC